MFYTGLTKSGFSQAEFAVEVMRLIDSSPRRREFSRQEQQLSQLKPNRKSKQTAMKSDGENPPVQKQSNGSAVLHEVCYFGTVLSN